MNRNPPAQVALATCAEVFGVEKDDLQVIDALGRRGIDAAHAVWDDPNRRVILPSYCTPGSIWCRGRMVNR